jgi:chromosome segregation ATPase
MKDNESDTETGPDQDLTNLKLDHNDHKQSNTQEDTYMDEVTLKTAKLSKLNLLITILGLGVLGYLHFSGKDATDDAIAKSKATLKQEVVSDMKEGLASTEQLQALTEKNDALEAKVNRYADQISTLEMKIEQFQVELEKNASLRAKVNELQSSMKKAKPVAKPAATKATKSNASRKPVKKGKK